jgi:diketogulonate reductase-like aldo/keto reductase
MNLFKKIYFVVLLNILSMPAFGFKFVCDGANCFIDGKKYSMIGFGTYPLVGAACTTALDQAISNGYQIIDTATFYKNFDAMHAPLKKHNRKNLYVISKVWPDAHTRTKMRTDLKTTLKLLQTDYLDAYLLHWPNSKISISESLLAMQELQNQGLVRHIGLSNVSVNHLKKALKVGVAISWVQIEMHPSFYDAQLLEFCKKNSIGVQAWAPLGRGRLTENILLKKLGKKYKKTAAQIALRWIIQHGCIPLPGSRNTDHIRENFNVADFVISDDDMRLINENAKNGKRERYSLDEFDFTYDECWPL